MVASSRSSAPITKLNKKDIWAALSDVPDPEMPIVNLVELGIIRQVELKDSLATITITPTFSACPAYNVMKQDIQNKIEELGVSKVDVQLRNNPPWTSEWITDRAREKLKSIGLTPPPRHDGNFLQVLIDPVPCPHCDSDNTSLRNSFGTTPCRMIYTCNNCREPFEMFKPL
jgi:ring-1,2-phenylacetyl-CoA epoxidase subunit PaaD